MTDKLSLYFHYFLLSKQTTGKNKQRGYVSYAQLGINQLGAVYEGLMAYMAMDSNDYKVMGFITPYGPPPVPEGFPSDSTS